MRLILLFLLYHAAITAFAQLPSDQEVPIRLNRHYFEIPLEDSIDHYYNKFVSYSKDSTLLERIFTRDGKVHRVVMTKPATEAYQERITDQYNEYYELEWRKTENLHNKKFLTLYYFDNKVVGQVLSDSNTLYHVARNGETEPTQQNFNDFEPQILGPIADWNEFIFNNLQLGSNLRTEKVETFWIAVLVNAHGIVEQVEWANPVDGNPKIAAAFVRAVKRWGNNFTPAVDSFGNPTTRWLTIPFRVDRPA